MVKSFDAEGFRAAIESGDFNRIKEACEEVDTFDPEIKTRASQIIKDVAGQRDKPKKKPYTMPTDPVYVSLLEREEVLPTSQDYFKAIQSWMNSTKNNNN